ncbi:GNAT family N-acetyltransferase [Sporomusa termitida]|uniref:Acetyltransferase (GNAT) domain protein n=1 Tax=Sporomusa termitida TaxID=2377 RepID=A0A517DWI0_9FIRM|nr:GNAT family N-acetyltransferase [Sporomusa termitida]QDR81711.1 Acetyltransferase (GNAT) domain protein [Sporomusa termitida]
MKDYTIGEITPEEAGSALTLINATFDRFVGPGYSEQGIQAFKDFITRERRQQGFTDYAFMLVARQERQIIGVIEIWHYRHITLLFTAAEWHNRGVAKRLLQAAISICRRENPALNEISVRSSPFAVPVYQKLGFIASGHEQTVDGMRFTEMTKPIP